MHALNDAVTVNYNKCDDNTHLISIDKYVSIGGFQQKTTHSLDFTDQQFIYFLDQINATPNKETKTND